MHAERDDVIRVGIRLVVVAATVGFLVLALGREARSQEPADPLLEAALSLVPDEPLPPRARVDEAQRLLGDARRQRLADVGGAVLDLAWRGATSGSPRRLLRAGRRVANELRSLGARTRAEDRALELLEHDVALGRADARERELYARLRSREDEERVERWLGEAERALARGETMSARRRLDWIAALRPDESRLPALRLAASGPPLSAEMSAPPVALEPIEAWEVSLAAALLVGDYERVLASERARPDVELAQAAALFLSGDRAAAGERLRELEEEGGRRAELAGTWLADTRFFPETALASSERRFRVRKVLGWLGGDELEQNGLSLSRDGVDAWRATLSPFNLALSLPARLLSGRRPEGDELHAAAASYLERVPSGPRAADARAWLAQDPGGKETRRSARPFDDGHFVLPAARTPYTHTGPSPVLVTPSGLDSVSGDRFARLGIDVDTDASLLLTLVDDDVPDTAISLPRDTALRLTAGLARGLENGALATIGGDVSEQLEGLRRIDRSLRDGATLVVDPWQPETDEGSELSRALVEGGSPARVRQLRVSRSSSSVHVERDLFAGPARCPEATHCIDRARSYDGRLSARLEDDGEARVGLRSQIVDARLALEIGRTGPRASLALPIGRWLGLDRWLPAELRLDLSIDGFAAEPALGRPEQRGALLYAGR